MSTNVDLVGPLAAAKARGFGLGVERAGQTAGQPGWRPAASAAQDSALLAALLARTAAGAGTRSLAVAATWHLEKHAWFAAGAALAGVVVHGATPPLDGAALRDGEYGWAEAIALPDDGWQAADGPVLAERLETHLAPLVSALSAHRPARALWRSAGDRLGQAALWCAEAFDRESAITVAAAALDAPTAFRAPPAFTMRAGERFRPRTGCCLSHRCPGAITCADCPLVCRKSQASSC